MRASPRNVAVQRASEACRGALSWLGRYLAARENDSPQLALGRGESSGCLDGEASIAEPGNHLAVSTAMDIGPHRVPAVALSLQLHLITNVEAEQQRATGPKYPLEESAWRGVEAARVANQAEHGTRARESSIDTRALDAAQHLTRSSRSLRSRLI
jgi:hypothetical protein